jgi:hypothetical protein
MMHAQEQTTPPPLRPPKKPSAVPIILAFMFPGAGHFAQKRPLLGVVYLVVVLGCLVVGGIFALGPYFKLLSELLVADLNFHDPDISRIVLGIGILLAGVAIMFIGVADVWVYYARSLKKWEHRDKCGATGTSPQ